MQTETASRLHLSGVEFDLQVLVQNGRRLLAFIHEQPVMGGIGILITLLLAALVIHILATPWRMWARSKRKKRWLASLLSGEAHEAPALPVLHELARVYGKRVDDPVGASELGFVTKGDGEGEEEEIFVPSRFWILEVPNGQAGAVKALFRELGHELGWFCSLSPKRGRSAVFSSQFGFRV